MAPRKTPATTAPAKAPASTALVKATGRAVVAPTAPPDPSQALAAYYAGQLTAIDKRLRIRAGPQSFAKPVSTGLLCVDWVLSGGMRTAFNQVSGFEQAAKSSLMINTFGSAVRAKIPQIMVHDAEGTMSPDYTSAMLNGLQLDQTFDDVFRRYYSTNVLEEATVQMARLLQKMPDKLYIDEVGAWCYVIPKGLPQWTPVIEALKSAGMPADKNASSEGYWIIPTAYTGPEAAIFLDSWPAMIPEAVDDLIDSDKKTGAGLAIVARTLSEELPKFAGRLKRKGVMFFSVNQLREAPMQLPPVKEAGGNALKLYTTVRNQMAVRAVPPGWDRDPEASQFCIEESVTGNGYDRYAFKSFNNTKNKLGRPLLKTTVRVWTSDENGKPRGFDPVYDTFRYLQHTGQVEGTKGRTFVLRFRPSIPTNARVQALAGKQMNWATFKQLIVAEHFKNRAQFKEVAEALGLTSAPNLREHLFQQLRVDTGLWGEIATGGDD